MATIDLGKVRGEDGKDGVGGGSASIELLEKPLLESEVYQVRTESSEGIVTFPKWNIPIQIDKIKSPPKKGDIISIVLESPYAGSRGTISIFQIDFKCIASATMVFENIPMPVTNCSFRVIAIAEPNYSFNNRTSGGYYCSVEPSSYFHFDDVVLLGGVDDFEYLHGLADVLKYADEHCGGIIEGVNTSEIRKEIGDGKVLEMIAFYSGGDVLPWWKYSTSSSTDTSGNISCLWFVLNNLTSAGMLPTSFEAYGIRTAANSGGTAQHGCYTGQYIIKSVKFKEM